MGCTLPSSARTAVALGLLVLGILNALELRGVATATLLAGGAIGEALLFVFGPAPHWPAALVMSGFLMVLGNTLIRAASWANASF